MVLQSRITEMGSRIQEDKREMEASNEKVLVFYHKINIRL